jgi:hypothetical protein
LVSKPVRARQRLFPRGFAEHREAVLVAKVRIRISLRRVIAAHERLSETFRGRDVVVAEAAFDAQAILVRVAVAAVDLHDAVALHGNRRLTADATERTQRVDDLVEFLYGALRRRLVHQRFLVERAGRARLHALTAGHARRHTHRVVDVEHGHGMAGAQAHADDVVDLNFAARAHARAARNAGIEVHGDRGIRDIEDCRSVLAAELRGIALAAGNAHRRRPLPERRLIVGPLLARPHVAREQLEHHAARLHCALRLRRHFHAGRRLADARRGQHALALDLHHARAAVAVDAVARQVHVAQVRDLRAFALSHVPDGLAGCCGDFLAVELENDRIAHFKDPFRNSVSRWLTGFGAA